MSNNAVWNNITTHLKSVIPESQISTWLLPAQLIELNQNLAVIEVPNKFVASWLSEHYLEQIRTSFYYTLNYIPEIHFSFRGLKIQGRQDDFKAPKKNHPTAPIDRNQDFTFENFVTAKCNRFAFSLAMEVANAPAEKYNPLYLFSRLSTGKTHLLHAIANRIIEKNPSANVVFVSAEKFSSDFVCLNKTKNKQEIKMCYFGGECIIIDDFQKITPKELIQKELIKIISCFLESKKQIVIAGQSSPSHIQHLMPELRSRLEWGLLSEIHPPDQKTRMKIIKKKAKIEKINIPDDVAFFLATSVTDSKMLGDCLVSLRSYASVNQGEINISAVKSIMKNRPAYQVSIPAIQKATAHHFNISVGELLSNKKTHKVSYPRHIAMYLCRELTGFSLKDIAKAFGNKDHSTIIYAIKHIRKEQETDKKVSDDLNTLFAFVSQNFDKSNSIEVLNPEEGVF
jgi:chromosomal replication initiator protein